MLAHIQSGKVKALAVASAKRNARLPNVPTFAEAGIKGVEMGAWYGIYMPASTPKAVQDRVHQEVNKLMATAGNARAPGDDRRRHHADDAGRSSRASTMRRTSATRELIKRRGIKVE